MNNINQIMQLLNASSNPQTFLFNMIKQQSGNNPIMNNVMNMVQNGDSKGVEIIARNICRERGINPDEMINNLKNQMNSR